MLTSDETDNKDAMHLQNGQLVFIFRTMEGDIDSEKNRGVIPRACNHIFHALNIPGRFVESNVKVSFLEIYNEELNDLLVDTTTPLKVCEDRNGRVKCMGLSKKVVNSADEVFATLREAQARRQVGETKMNKSSSRSHCLFTLDVLSKEMTPQGLVERRGKIHMVDLAGSECAKTTGAGAGSARLRESQNINKSLLTLGRVIGALRTKTGRIPYRDSKLTRLLQEALGGRSKTCIIATLSPSSLCVEETLSTLNYAHEAQDIKNKSISATVRMQAGGSSSSIIAGSAEEKHDRRSFAEMEQRMRYMESQLEEAQAALGRQFDERSFLEGRANEAEAKAAELQNNLKEASANLAQVQSKLEEANTGNTMLYKSLESTRVVLAGSEAVVSARTEAENKLHDEAKQLLQCVNQMIQDRSNLHAELETLATKEQQLKTSAVSFRDNSTSLLDNASTGMKTQLTARLNAALNGLSTHTEQCTTGLEGSQQLMTSLTSNIGGSVESARSLVSEEMARVVSEATVGLEQSGSQVMDLASQGVQAMTTSQEQLQQLDQLFNQGESELKQHGVDANTRLDSAQTRLTEGIKSHETSLADHSSFYQQALAQWNQSLQNETLTLTAASNNIATQLSLLESNSSHLQDTQATMTQRLNSHSEQLQQQAANLHEAREEHSAAEARLRDAHDETLSSLFNSVTQTTQAQEATLQAQATLLTSAQTVLKDSLLPFLNSNLTALSSQRQNLTTASDNTEQSLKVQRDNLQQTHTTQAAQLADNEREHLASLGATKELVDTTIVESRTLLQQQNTGLQTLVSDDLEGRATEASAAHVAALRSAHAALSAGATEQSRLLQAQSATIGSTRETYLSNQTELEQTMTGAVTATESRVNTFSTQQHELLATQTQQLEQARAAQEEGQQRVLTEVVAGLQEMLATKMQELLAASLNTHMQQILSTTSNIQRETKRLDQDIITKAGELQTHTQSWCEVGNSLASSLSTMESENNSINTQVQTVSQQATEDFEAHVVSANAWTQVDQDVAQGLRLASQQNEEAGFGLDACQATFEEQSQQLVQETEQWAQRERKVGEAISLATQQNIALSAQVAEMATEQGAGLDQMEADTRGLGEENERMQELVNDIESRNADLTTAVIASRTTHEGMLNTAQTELKSLHETANNLTSAVDAANQQTQVNVDELAEVQQSLMVHLEKASDYSQQLQITTNNVQTQVSQTLTDSNSASVELHGSLSSAVAEHHTVNAQSVNGLVTGMQTHVAAEKQATEDMLTARVATAEQRNASSAALTQHLATASTQLNEQAQHTSTALTRQTEDLSSSLTVMKNAHTEQMQALETQMDSVAQQFTAHIQAQTAAVTEACAQDSAVLTEAVTQTAELVESLESVSGDVASFCTEQVDCDTAATMPTALTEASFPNELSELPVDENVIAEAKEDIAVTVAAQMDATKQAVAGISEVVDKENTTPPVSPMTTLRHVSGGSRGVLQPRVLNDLSNTRSNKKGKENALKRPATAFPILVKEPRSAKKMKRGTSTEREPAKKNSKIKSPAMTTRSRKRAGNSTLSSGIPTHKLRSSN